MEIVSGPGRRSVSPPIRWQPKRAWAVAEAGGEARRARRWQARPGTTAPSGSRSGVAPLAARSETLTASAFQAMSSGASSARKCTPSATGSVLSTSSVPGAGVSSAQSSLRPKAPGKPSRQRRQEARMMASSPVTRLSVLSLLIDGLKGRMSGRSPSIRLDLALIRSSNVGLRAADANPKPTPQRTPSASACDAPPRELRCSGRQLMRAGHARRPRAVCSLTATTASVSSYEARARGSGAAGPRTKWQPWSVARCVRLVSPWAMARSERLDVSPSRERWSRGSCSRPALRGG